jgi:hypothetical protein
LPRTIVVACAETSSALDEIAVDSSWPYLAI